jgi:hypothetical protein
MSDAPLEWYKTDATLRDAALVHHEALDALAQAERLAADLLVEADRRARLIVTRAGSSAPLAADTPFLRYPRAAPVPESTTSGTTRDAPSTPDATPSAGSTAAVRWPAAIWVEEPRTKQDAPADRGGAPVAEEASPPSLTFFTEEFCAAIYRAVLGTEPLDRRWYDDDDVKQMADARGRAGAIRSAAKRAATRAATERRAIQQDALERRLSSRRSPGNDEGKDPRNTRPLVP